MRGCVAVIIGRGIGGDRPARNDFGTQPGIGREHAMEANEMEPWTGDKRSQSLHEFQRRHHNVGRAISIGCLQC